MRKISTIIIITAFMSFLGYLQAPVLHPQDTEVELLMNNYSINIQRNMNEHHMKHGVSNSEIRIINTYQDELEKHYRNQPLGF